MPIPDGRGPVDYKRHLAGVLTKRALRTAAARALKQEAWHGHLDRHQRRDGDARRRAAHAARALHPRHRGPDRHPLGLRHLQLRRLRRADGRQAAEVLHRAGRDVRGPRDRDRRVARGRRRARPDPAGLPRVPRAAVRVLHARDADDHAGAAGREPGPDGGGDPRRDLRRDLPLHGLQEHRRRDPMGRRASGGDRDERDRGPADRLRPPEAQGGRALHPRPGQLPGRHPPARHGPHGDPALARSRTRRSTRSTRPPRSRCRASPR